MSGSEQARDRRRTTRKAIMGALFVVIVLAGIGIFVVTANNAPKTDIASQELLMPSIAPDPMISPPDQPLPTPTVPPVPLPDASNTGRMIEPASTPLP
ncbi:MAG: hypothetical protein SGJ23_03640 [Alphaproteobacteria bacterium]|nr:hypothetical protein [Alphaproteobacteria bacterium]